MGYAKDNPHDKRHKELLSNKKSFLSLLRDCVKEPWVYDLDEDSITKTNNSFILQDFSEKEADIVYEAILNGKTVIFYILLELQSKVDYRMPYRLLLYIVEILRYYYNHADVNERDNKDFTFPVVFPIVFFSGKDTWTVPFNLREMFSDYETFGDYVLNFEYMLVNAKGYDDDTLKGFSSKLLGLILMLEKTKNDLEFYSSIRNNLDSIGTFDNEEKRVLSLCIKIMDIAYGYNKGDDIQRLLSENQIQEVDKMLCDVIEYAKVEKEELISQGELNAKLTVAKKMLMEKLPIDIIVRTTELSREQIEGISL
ncbi:MAG: Rpn family recombination-promoting nuclease/putative transposase [Defluviitaleaceae bacterium]|nr:Rpn family recombination-promoting nuclease/putative transposase [Defluviitaleaceae bacterium]